MSSKRKALCVDEKVCLIRAIENGERKADVGKRFGLSASTVTTIWKNKDKILKAELGGKSKKLRKPKFEDLDQAMLSWFDSQEQNDVSVSGPMLKAKAKEFAEQLGITDFKASEGWLGKFKHRYSIQKMNKEARSFDKTVNNNWINEVWPTLKEKYSQNDIFKADQLGLFFKTTLDETYFYGESVENEKEKLSEEHVTVILAANLSGTQKRKLLVVGTSENLWRFKKIKQIHVTYEASKSAWMTTQFFEEELREWDAGLKGQKILLLVETCLNQPLISNLQNIELVFFPADTASILQPVEHVIRSYYRRKFMGLMETDEKTSINMLQAVNLVSKAWKEVSTETIQQTFSHTGSCDSEAAKTEQSVSENILSQSWIEQANVPRNLNNYKDLQARGNIHQPVSMTEEDKLDSESKHEEKQIEIEDD